jgi:hypothetical protein
MAGQPLDGSWAQSRPQPQPYEQAQYQSYPPAQEHATTPGAARPDGAYQQGAWEQAGYQQAGYQEQQEQQAYQAYQGLRPAAPRAARSKGFLASLFDFSFSSFVTPKIIRFLYVLSTIWTAVLTIAFCSLCLRIGGDGGGTIVFLIIAAPILFLLGLGSIRVGFEVFMVLHRLNENVQEIRDRGDMSQ